MELKRRYKDSCYHNDGAYLGQLGRYDVSVDRDANADLTTCLRYGHSGSEYINSGGGGELASVKALVLNLISEHERIVGELKNKIKSLKWSLMCSGEEVVDLEYEVGRLNGCVMKRK